MTNAHGYASRRREENSMDPNRDFPYLQRPELCMRTQTARAVNDTCLYRQTVCCAKGHKIEFSWQIVIIR